MSIYIVFYKVGLYLGDTSLPGTARRHIMPCNVFAALYFAQFAASCDSQPVHYKGARLGWTWNLLACTYVALGAKAAHTQK